MKTITVDIIPLKDAVKMGAALSVYSILSSLKEHSSDGYTIIVIEEVTIDPAKNLKYQRELKRLSSTKEIEKWIKEEFPTYNQ